MDLTQQDLLRYTRQLPVIGLQGQQCLKAARVLCVGAGGLGCPALQYLAAAGVGVLAIADGDAVEISNLQRQILFTEHDISQNKAIAAASRLRAMNSRITIKPIEQFLCESNAESLIASYDIVIDATDNFVARYLMNRYCRLHGIPLISASVFQTQAQLSVFNLNNGPCYECLYPEPLPSEYVPNCALGGVMGLVPGVLGVLQANEAIKIMLSLDGILSGSLLTVDLNTLEFQRYSIAKKTTCQATSCAPQSRRVKDGSVKENTVKTISCNELSQLIRGQKAMSLIDVRESYERDICHIGGKHIPLGQLGCQPNSWPLEEVIVVYCKSGVRSERAALQLQQAGYAEVYSLAGGIMAWIEQVDTSLLRY